MTLLRVGPQQPNKVVLKIVEPEDDIHCVAWSYDPIRLMPLITFAGRKGLIYIWRLSLEPGQGAERLRVLRGHGEVRQARLILQPIWALLILDRILQEIYSLKYHLSSPHVRLREGLPAGRPRSFFSDSRSMPPPDPRLDFTRYDRPRLECARH